MTYWILSSYGISRQVKEEILSKESPIRSQSIIKYINTCGFLATLGVFVLVRTVSPDFELGIALLFHSFNEVLEVFGLDHHLV